MWLGAGPGPGVNGHSGPPSPPHPRTEASHRHQHLLPFIANSPWSVPPQPEHSMDFVSREQFMNFTKQLQARVLLIK